MNGNHILKWARESLNRFRREQRGNVAMTFGLAMIPIIACVGSAVDYSRASSARTAMQAGLDAAALILSKDAQSMTTAQLEAKAAAVFNANFNHTDVEGVVVTPTFTTLEPGRFSLRISVSGRVPTTFMGIWQDYIDINASGEAVWGIKRLELALALDNTGSMSSSNKMTQLKAATKVLLTTLQNAAKKAEDVQISIVPFATDVNVGTGNVNASWIRWDEWEASNGTCSANTKNKTYDTKSACTAASGTWTPKNKSSWNGCVWDRDQDHDVTNTAASAGTKATLYSAHQASACPASMMTLTNDWTKLNAKVDAMTPTGNTNVTIGLQMAFQTISPVAPFNASAPKTDLDKVIILLTDGDNTESRYSTKQTTIDARTRLACDNAKAANVKIYTIRVINGNASLLRDCATKPDMYYDVQNANQLTAVFGAIAQNLANLRLVK